MLSHGFFDKTVLIHTSIGAANSPTGNVIHTRIGAAKPSSGADTH